MSNNGLGNPVLPSDFMTTRRSNWKMYLLAFAFPFVLVIVALGILGVYPFGDHTILTVDCYHQYVPYMIELSNKLKSGDSLFYTWIDGLGMEFYAAFANYCSSPLNIFCIFFTAKTMPILVYLLTAIRAGLASVFMTLFLSDTERRRPDLITVGFAMMYAFCGWFITDFWNIMWCDAMVLLPLICYGLRKLLKEGKYAIYVLSLFCALFSNYYSGYFICLFLIMFAPIMYFTEFKTKSERVENERDVLSFATFTRSVGRFILGSLIAGMLSGILTIPTFFILQNTSATGSELEWNFKLQDSLFDFLARFMAAANPNIRDGMANVYSGTLCVLLTPLFFLAPSCTGIKKRHKILYGILLGVLYLSFTNRTLIYIWHGFHFPNQIPHRESFLMSFVIILMAFKLVRYIRAFEWRTIKTVLCISFAFIILYEKIGEGNESYIQYLVSIVFLSIIGTVLFVIRRNAHPRSKRYAIILWIATSIECITVTLLSFGMVDMNEAFPSYNTFGQNYDVVYEEANEFSAGKLDSDKHNSFERVEIYPCFNCNIQSVYNVKGIGIFSSTARESYVKYMRNFGFHNNGINSLRGCGLTRPTATLLGVRGAISFKTTEEIPLFFDPVQTVMVRNPKPKDSDDDTEEKVVVCSNPDALSVGYMVSEELLNYEPDVNTADTFYKTNLWIQSMGVPQEVYSRINAHNLETNGFEFISEGNAKLSYNVKGTSNCKLTFTIDEATPNSELYIYQNSSKAGRIRITHSDESVKAFDFKANQCICLGTYTGEPITVELTYGTPPTNQLSVYTYELDWDAYNAMCEILGRNQLEITSYTSDSIEGSITCDEGGLLLLTIPYTEGFEAMVDGEASEIIPVADALCSLRLSPGTHHISLKYMPPYFSIGVISTLIGAGLLILVMLFGLVLRRLRARRDLSSEAEKVTDTVSYDEAVDETGKTENNETVETTEELEIDKTSESTEAVETVETVETVESTESESKAAEYENESDNKTENELENDSETASESENY